MAFKIWLCLLYVFSWSKSLMTLQIIFARFEEKRKNFDAQWFLWVISIVPRVSSTISLNMKTSFTWIFRVQAYAPDIYNYIFIREKVSKQFSKLHFLASHSHLWLSCTISQNTVQCKDWTWRCEICFCLWFCFFC